MKVSKVNKDYALESNLEGQKFGIEEDKVGFIFSILREGMYQDPIGTICREIMSNCLDAHTMAKCDDRPFEITLPNAFNSEICFRDFGPGMSAEFMNTKFLGVGTSTKDESDEFIGGWGLGRLTPWSYSDSFVVETIHNGVKRIYGCYLDDSDRGELRLMAETPTDEESGTLVKLAVKAQDHSRFREKVMFYGSYMEPKPIIHGPKPEWPEVDKKLSGKGWYAVEVSKPRFYGNNPATLVVGRIPYRIDKSSLTTELRHRAALNCGLVIECGVGDVDVATNRENLRYTDKTLKFLSRRLDEVKNDIARSVSDKIKGESCLWDAVIAYESIPYDLRKLAGSKATWNNYPIDDKYKVEDRVNVQVFTKDENGNIKINSSKFNSSSIHPSKGSRFYINDYGTSTHKSRIQRIFDDNPDVNHVKVYKHKDGPQANLDIRRTTHQNVSKPIPMDQLKIGLLSKVDPVAKPKKLVTQNGSTTKVVSKKPKGTQRFLLYKGHTIDYSRTGLYSKCEEVIVDPKVGGYYVLVDKGYSNLVNGNTHSEADILSYLKRTLGVDIYLVKAKQEKYVEDSNWVNLKDELEKTVDKYLNNKVLDYVHCLAAFSIGQSLETAIKADPRPSLLKDTINYRDECLEEIKRIHKECPSLLSLIRDVARSKSHTSKLDTLYSSCRKKYPLIMNSLSPKDHVDYVHLVEEYHKVVKLRDSELNTSIA